MLIYLFDDRFINNVYLQGENVIVEIDAHFDKISKNRMILKDSNLTVEGQ